MPTQNFFPHAPVICAVMHLLYTVRCACKCCCPGELLPGPVNISCRAGAELSSASGVRFLLLGPTWLVWCQLADMYESSSSSWEHCRPTHVYRGAFLSHTWENWELHARSLHVTRSLLHSTQFWLGSGDGANQSQSHLQGFSLETQSRRNAISVKW